MSWKKTSHTGTYKWNVKDGQRARKKELSEAEKMEQEARLNEARKLVKMTLATVKRRFTLSYDQLVFRYYWQAIMTAAKIIDTATEEQKEFIKYFIFAWKEELNKTKMEEM